MGFRAWRALFLGPGSLAERFPSPFSTCCLVCPKALTEPSAPALRAAAVTPNTDRRPMVSFEFAFFIFTFTSLFRPRSGAESLPLPRSDAGLEARVHFLNRTDTFERRALHLRAEPRGPRGRPCSYLIRCLKRDEPTKPNSARYLSGFAHQATCSNDFGQGSR